MSFKINLINSNKFPDYIQLIYEIIENCTKTNISLNIPFLIYGGSKFEKELLIFWLKKSLGKRLPSSKIIGDCISVNEPNQIKEIIKNQKKSIGIRIHEYLEYYEGEVTDIILNSEHSNELQKNAYGILSLKTLEGKLRIKISGIVYKEFLFKKVEKGDIIRIIPESYLIQNLGRSICSTDNYPVNNENYFTIPKGKVLKKKILIKEVTLFDFEFENCKHKNNFEFLNIENVGKLNEDIGILLQNYDKCGKAKIFRGILYVDNAHYLNFKCFCFLTSTFGNFLCPTTILFTNKTDFLNSESFYLDSFNISNLNHWVTVPLRVFAKNQILKIICLNFLKKKIFLSSSAIQLLEFFLKKSDLKFIFSLIFLTSISIFKERLAWICKNSLSFFNSIILNYRELFFLNSSKNNFVKIHRSL
jgi:RuvB-like protein 1 (pontin 52)